MNTSLFTASAALRLSVLFALIAGFSLLLVTACDFARHAQEEPAEVAGEALTWQGIHFVAEGEAQLSAEDGLRLDGEPGTSRLIIEAPGIRGADFLFAPAAISTERPFSIDLVGTGLDGESAVLSGIVHQRRSDGRVDLKKALGQLRPTSITVECRIGNRSIFSREHLLSTVEDTFFTSTSDDEPTSYHYYEDGDTIIVEVDYDDDDGDGDGEGESSESQQLHTATMEFASGEVTRCTHVSFRMTDVRTGFEKVEGIEMAGLSQLYMREAHAR